jgi:hypothetical protein
MFFLLKKIHGQKNPPNIRPLLLTCAKRREWGNDPLANYQEKSHSSIPIPTKHQ